MLKRIIESIFSPSKMIVREEIANPQPSHLELSTVGNFTMAKTATAPVKEKKGAVLPTSKKTSAPNIKEATTADVERILSYPGEVITASNPIVSLPESQKQYLALFAGVNGRKNILIVAKDYAFHHETSSARSTLRKKGISWGGEYLVDLDVIQKVYENVNYDKGSLSSNSEDPVAMQREFVSLVEKASRINASDIHLTVNRMSAVVRIRSDGVMMKLQEMTSASATQLCQAIFAMAESSDPTYKPHEYQGARVTQASASSKGLRLPEGVESIRLQFNPLPNAGRYLIARLLYAQKIASTADIDELGYAPNQIAQIKEMRRKPFGINFISGPTGSGKSTTLQRGLTALMRERPGLNVVTIEDPPEYVIEGAAQLPVTNAKTAEERAEKFRQAITAALRSDPDVIMIGEVRDGASGSLAFQAGMTGHGVWASLHTNDAISIIDRLRDMGVEDYKLFDATLLTGLVGQRLIRKINPDYAVDFSEAIRLGLINEELKRSVQRIAGDRIADVRFAGTHQKDLTTRQLYSGRRVVAEVISPDQQFLDLLKAGNKEKARQYWKDNLGGMSMLEHAVGLMCQGVFDAREIESKAGLLKDFQSERLDAILNLMHEE